LGATRATAAETMMADIITSRQGAATIQRISQRAAL
jgi:hypothetical protein